jgi:gluconokinase
VIVIIFGVSGAGKTTVGKLLAEDLGWQFYEADDFHPRANIEKMRSPERLSGLTDEDRWPWLERLREQIRKSIEAHQNAVLACSALRRAYRERLSISDDVKSVFLRGNYALISEQLRQRRGHFMNPNLLESQFADLEEPEADEGVLTIELGRRPEELVEEIKTKLQLVGKD